MEEPPQKKKPQPISSRYVPALFIGRNNEKVYYISAGIVTDTIDFEEAEACPSLAVDSLCDIKITSYDNDTQELSFVQTSDDRKELLMRLRPVESVEEYRTYVLRALVMGSRALEHHYTTATVIERQDEEIVKVSLTAPPFCTTDTVFLRTESAQIFECTVEKVQETGAILKTRGKLPTSIAPNTLLQIISKEDTTVVSDILPMFYTTCEIENWNLLERIYGKTKKAVDPYSSVESTTEIHLKDSKTPFTLNEGQSEAVGRYNNSTCPAFAVEGSTGSGESVTAVAMAASFSGEGLQLLLAVTDDAVVKMARALEKLNVGDRKVTHISSGNERDGEETWIYSYASPADISQKYDVVLATVDAILRRSCNDELQEQLKTDVARVVVDEASQLSEAALNAIILCFPRAQIVLIGDSEQLKPSRYVKGEVASEMAGRSALELFKKKNLPIVKLREAYRAASRAVS